MNRFLCTDPYPGLRGFGCKLPSGRIWRYDPAVAHMHNSGIIGVNADHVPALLDAAALIDALHERHFVAGDLEQFAVSETLRLHDAEINENDTTFVHYYRHWRKSYMEARLAAAFASVAGEVLPCRPFIPLTKTRTRIHKRRTQAVVMFDAMRTQAAVAATRWNFQRRARRPMGEGLRAQS